MKLKSKSVKARARCQKVTDPITSWSKNYTNGVMKNGNLTDMPPDAGLEQEVIFNA